MSPSLVISLVALFVALGGTGYAAVTISGADIANNTVTGRDVKNRTLKGRDVGRDALRGAQIRESSLARVPLADSARVADTAGLAARADTAGHADAAASAATANQATIADNATSAERADLLDGIDSLGFARVRSISSSTITEGSSLTLLVPGFGSYSILCDDNGADDLVSFAQLSGLGAGAIESGLISAADPPGTAVIGDTSAGDGSETVYPLAGDRITVTFRSAVPGTEKAVVVEANGHENEGNEQCHGQIQAFMLG